VVRFDIQGYAQYELDWDFVSPTFSSILNVNFQFKVRPIAQSTLVDDLTLEFEDGNTSAIESNPRGFFLGLEFEMN
jgi:hypothetical protein